MKYLLDTHVLLWGLGNEEKLSKEAFRIIRDRANKKFVSIASAWEVAIKISTGKLDFDGGISEFFRMIDDNGLILFPIKREYMRIVETLPLLHRDPFDRLLVSSALVEGLTIITADEDIHKYDVQWVW